MSVCHSFNRFSVLKPVALVIGTVKLSSQAKTGHTRMLRSRLHETPAHQRKAGPTKERVYAIITPALPSTTYPRKNNSATMHTRSRSRKQQHQRHRPATPDSPTPNGTFSAKPDDALLSGDNTDIADSTRQINGLVTLSEESTVVGTPVKMRPGIYRVPLATWNFFVRKWEIPRKALHVSIGAEPVFSPTVLHFPLSLILFLLSIFLAFGFEWRDSDLIGFVCLLLYKLGYEPRDIAPSLVVMFIPAFFGDVIRFMWPAFNRLYIRVMGPLMRDREKQQWNGVIFYLLGAWIVLSFFPKVIPNPSFPLFTSVLRANRLRDERTLQSSQSSCCHGRTPQPRPLAASTGNTAPNSAPGNPSSDPEQPCSQAPWPPTSTGVFYIPVMRVMCLPTISIGPKTRFSISRLPVRGV